MSHSGLVRCGNCGVIFNAAWNLVDEIPNPVESTTLIGANPTSEKDNNRISLRVTGQTRKAPHFFSEKRWFSLDDQLRQDLNMDVYDSEGLEEIRRALDRNDTSGRLQRSSEPSLHSTIDAAQENISNSVEPVPQITKLKSTNNGSRTAKYRSSERKLSRGYRLKTQVLWLLATLVAASSLYAQTKYWLFDELAAIPSARGSLESFCRIANCSVPAPLIGPNFRILKTRIDLDPQLPGAVIVQVHIENRTTIPRPYPDIELTLTDRKSRTVGQRTYASRDYGAETDPHELFPRTIAVIRLHLSRPDEDAVRFEPRIVNSRN